MPLNRSLLFFLLLSLSLAACDGDPSAADAGPGVDAGPMADAGGEDAGAPEGWRFETIETRTVTVEGMSFEAELLRTLRPDGGVSYLLYLPVAAPNAPLVVMTEPYAGVDWTGEEVDARWAARGDGLHDDDDAPSWDGDDQISYGAQSVEEAVGGSLLFLRQGVAVVRPYGRFYAGGDIADDVMDSVAPYRFAMSREGELDLSHMGAYGGSWGGFMALYGAAFAPEGAAPLSVVALAPPSDFADMWEWASGLPSIYPTPDEAERFFSPYLRRIEAGAGGPPSSGDYSPFSWEAVCAGLRSEVIVPHDEWDVLVAVRQTEGLAERCPERILPMYWYRQMPTDYAAVGLSHGPFDGAPGVTTALTLPLTHLLLVLTGEAPVLTIADDLPLQGWLTTLREEQLAGGDPSEALPHLLDLADARVTAYRSDGGEARSGAAAVADAVNAVWGTSYDEANVAAALEGGLPTP
jgi:hypothetical protein